MSKNFVILIRWLLVLGAIALWPGRAAALPCGSGNVLANRRPTAERGVQFASRLTDGWTTLDAQNYDHPDAALFKGESSEVVWDLGEPMAIGGLALQADAGDDYIVDGSLDAQIWNTLWLAPAEATFGLKSRQWTGTPVPARYLRLMARGGDGLYSATELRAFCGPVTAVPPPWVHFNIPVSPLTLRTITGYSFKIALLLGGALVIFVIFPRVTNRQTRLLLAGGIVALSAIAWTHCFVFINDNPLHVSDSFHYYMGPKYFRSTGYFDLYRCVAKAERELGHGRDYERALVRDLDDNRIWPGTWLDSSSGQCRGHFAEDRWVQFKSDVAQFRELMAESIPLPRALADHGFNATPFHVSFLRLFTLHSTPTRGTLLAIAQLDSLSLLVAVGAFWWAFGPGFAALFALLVATGGHWGYQWVGGSIGRHVWLAWAAIGIGAARKKRTGLATFALTMAGLHRLFPFVFLGAYFVWLAADSVRKRKCTRELRQAAQIFATTLAAALFVTTVSLGPSALGSFGHVLVRHAQTPGGNRLGLPLLLAVGPDRFDSDLENPRLTDPTEVWVQQVKATKRAHWPLQLFAVVLALALVVRVAWRGATAWEVILAASPLVFALQDMTSYDYIWLALLTPLVLARERWRAWLVGYVLLTLVLTLLLANFEYQHFIFNWALCLVFVKLGVELYRLPTSTLAAPWASPARMRQ